MEAIGVGLIKAVTYIYDIITIPVYFILQQPWNKLAKAKEKRAGPLPNDPTCFRNVKPLSGLQIVMKRANIKTMDQVFRYAVKQNSSKACLGTRDILSEEDEVQPNKRVFKKYVLGDYRWLTYLEVEERVESVGRGLKQLGLTAGQRLVVFAETRAEWLITALACFRNNITLVTLYATLGDEGLIHGINETEVTYVMTSHDLFPKLKEVLKATPLVKEVVYMEDQLNKTDTTGLPPNVNIRSFRDLLENGKKSLEEPQAPSPDSIAVIMYTSGSTGMPKGVLLSHYNITSSMLAYASVLEIESRDTFIGYLPLAHVLELMAENMCILCGVPIGYSSPLTITDKSNKVKKGCKGDASVLQPTLVAAVPLILDRIAKAVQDNVAAGGKFFQSFFHFSYQYKLKWYTRGFSTPILDWLLFRRISQLMGGKVRVMASGGAPLSPETNEMITLVMCCPVLQGYGLTETCACASLSDVYDTSLGRVGAPLTCCDMRLVSWEEGNYRTTDWPKPRGEIVVGGDNIALGYFKQNSEMNDNFFTDGDKRWFKTGDIGEMDDDGVLRIIDRKKDLVKLQMGEYVSLGKVESVLKMSPVVDNICVYADPTKHFTVAIVVPLPKHLQDVGRKLGKTDASIEELCSDPDVIEAVSKMLAECGKRGHLERFEIPQAVMLSPEIWTPDTGLVTAAYKLRRKSIETRFKDDINRMYA